MYPTPAGYFVPPVLNYPVYVDGYIYKRNDHNKYISKEINLRMANFWVKKILRKGKFLHIIFSLVLIVKFMQFLRK